MNQSHNRRAFLRTAGLATAGALVLNGSKFSLAKGLLMDGPAFSLAPLPYAFNALEPHIDALTMEIHHDRHHKAYVDNFNKALTENKITEPSLEKILASVSTMPMAVRNNGGGHYNHTMFWQMMKPDGGGLPTGKVLEAINGAFGSVDVFKAKFSEAGKTRFGSGWAWLLKDKEGKLQIGSTPNQDNPLMDITEVKGTPILCMDVWEHAYYLKYQNKRADYISAFWNVVNWDEVAARI